MLTPTSTPLCQDYMNDVLATGAATVGCNPWLNTKAPTKKRSAIAICKECPLRWACVTDALEEGDFGTVRGGYDLSNVSGVIQGMIEARIPLQRIGSTVALAGDGRKVQIARKLRERKPLVVPFTLEFFTEKEEAVGFVVYALDPNKEVVKSPVLPNYQAAEQLADTYANVMGLTSVKIQEAYE